MCSVKIYGCETLVAINVIWNFVLVVKITDQGSGQVANFDDSWYLLIGSL